MKNRFNINESEKNRIRALHGMKVLNEVAELGVDLETELDVDLSNVSQNESDWEKDNWDELDDEQKEVYRTHSEFKDLEEDEVKEKYNNMEKGPLRDIIKNIVSWFRRLFKKDKDEYTKSKMSEDSVFKKIEGEIFSAKITHTSGFLDSTYPPLIPLILLTISCFFNFEKICSK